MKAPNVLRLLGEKKTEDNIPQNPFSNWGKLLRKAYIWAKCWWNVFNIPNERLSCEISSVSECQSDQLSSSSEETASVCGASLSREWDWGTGWAAPALGHQTAPWAGKGWARIVTFRFRYCFRMAGHGHGGGVGHQQLLPVKSVEFECSSWCHCTPWSCIR